MIPSVRRLIALIGIALLAGCAGQPVKPGVAKAAPAAPVPANPPPAVVDATAPPAYRIIFDSSQGPFVVEVTRAQAPNGADRLFSLVQAKYFDGARFYRVVPGFVVQWGAAADPALTKAWDRNIPDDPVNASNTRGTVTFAATREPNTRSTHLFINFTDNSRLDEMGFEPVGRVVSGMDNVERIYPDYGEDPDQGLIREQGNAYLGQKFPKLDYIRTARIAP